MLHATHIKQNKQTGRKMGGKVSLQKSYKMTSGHFCLVFFFKSSHFLFSAVLVFVFGQVNWNSFRQT